MEDIQTGSSPYIVPAFQQSFEKESRLEVSETSERGSPWVVDGIAFPSGTKLRGLYKGYFYYGEVRDGALMLDDKEFLSPCAAAITITRNPVDGWLFWDCRLPDQSSWESIYEIKQLL